MRKNIHQDRKQHWSCIHNDTILYFINRIFFFTYLAFFQHVISRAYLFHSRVNQDAHLLSGDINCTVWETRTQASLLRQLPIILEGRTEKSYGKKNFAILHFFVLWRWWCCLSFFFTCSFTASKASMRISAVDGEKVASCCHGESEPDNWVYWRKPRASTSRIGLMNLCLAHPVLVFMQLITPAHSCFGLVELGSVIDLGCRNPTFGQRAPGHLLGLKCKLI